MGQKFLEKISKNNTQKAKEQGKIPSLFTHLDKKIVRYAQKIKKIVPLNAKKRLQKKKALLRYNREKGGVRQFGAEYIVGGNPVW